MAELTDLKHTWALCWEAQNQRDEARRERDELRELRRHLDCRIAQQRRELARLSRLVADQRAAMAAEGIDYADAERLARAWNEAKRWHDEWTKLKEAEHGRQANDGREPADGQPGGSQNPPSR